jgi:hypothetical protein
MLGQPYSGLRLANSFKDFKNKKMHHEGTKKKHKTSCSSCLRGAKLLSFNKNYQ